MIFMSQSGLTDPAREPEWARWYVEHLAIMASVPGISSAQRFRTATPGFPPSLAMYSVAGPEVFQDPYYLSVRGMGEWLSLIDRQHYKRNLFTGLAHAPELIDGQTLLVTDREAPQADGPDVDWTWLESAGIDRSTPYRGIAVVPSAAAARLRAVANLALYEPAGPCHKPQA